MACHNSSVPRVMSRHLYHELEGEYTSANYHRVEESWCVRAHVPLVQAVALGEADCNNKCTCLSQPHIPVATLVKLQWLGSDHICSCIFFATNRQGLECQHESVTLSTLR